MLLHFFRPFSILFLRLLKRGQKIDAWYKHVARNDFIKWLRANFHTDVNTSAGTTNREAESRRWIRFSAIFVSLNHCVPATCTHSRLHPRRFSAETSWPDCVTEYATVPRRVSRIVDFLTNYNAVRSMKMSLIICEATCLPRKSWHL